MSTEKRCSQCGQPGTFRTIIRHGKPYEFPNCRACIAAYARDWRINKRKPEAKKWLAGYMRKYRPKWIRDNPEKNGYSKQWSKLNPEKYLWRAMKKRRVGKDGDPRYDVKMTYAEFLTEIGGSVPTKCPVLGIDMYVGDGLKADYLPSIDRIDTSRPYERGNIAVISWRANFIKNIGSADDHRRIADWMDRQQRRLPVAA